MRASTDLLSAEASGVSECLDRLAARKRQNRPLATYRLQFNKNFTFKDARKLLPYLSALGISHCYASPLLKARPGSPHGYDIIDHNAFNPEIGTEQEFRAFSSDLKSQGLELVLDIVPNHMGVGVGDNPWWQDVLENGRAAEHADFFDIDWNPLKPELKDKVLLPVLGDSYGTELESGRINVGFERSFVISYYDRSFPIDPQTVPAIYGARVAELSPTGEQASPISELDQVLQQLAQLPPHNERDPVRVTWRRDLAPRLLERLNNLVEASAIVRQTTQQA